MVLERMKAIASREAGFEVNNAVVTVPAYFNKSQRQATEDACQIADLNCLRIISEPTAASIAYGLHLSEEGLDEDEERTIVVFDLGGGTLDISILTVTEGVIDVEATSGDPFLGGRDFDNVLINLCVEEFKNNFEIDIRPN